MNFDRLHSKLHLIELRKRLWIKASNVSPYLIDRQRTYFVFTFRLTTTEQTSLVMGEREKLYHIFAPIICFLHLDLLNRKFGIPLQKTDFLFKHIGSKNFDLFLYTR